MRTRWLVGLAVFVAVTALPRAEAQTPEIQAAVDAMLAEAKPAAKSDDKAEAKPKLRAEAKPAAKSGDKAEGKPLMVPVIDYEDFVFVASDRPVLVRLHLRNNGRPYSAALDGYMKKFFTYFDKNGDGMLDKAEAERAPNMQFLQFQLQGNIGFPYQGQTVPIAQMDTNKDGKVSPAEFTGYYRRSGLSPLQFSNSSTQANTDTVTNTLLKHLDTNKDGKLSAEELAKAPAALERLDLDEDEMIATAELMPGGGDNNYGFVVVNNTVMAAPNAGGFLQINAGAVDGVARQVLTHYDKNKNGKLSREEAGLDEALFSQLDANRDDQLDAKEFAGFFRRDADLELMARMGKLEAKELQIASFLSKIGLGSQPIRAEVFNPSKRSMPLAAKVERHDASALAFGLGDARIGLSVSDQQFTQFNNIKQFYVQQFKQADTDKKGVLDSKKAKTSQFIDMIFPLLDRDGDGKLTEKELNAFLDMQVEGGGCQMQLTITDEGRSLFDLLDENGDSRLSIRELRSGWSRMKPLVKSDKGLSRQDIPRRLDVSIGQVQRRFRPGLVRSRVTTAVPAAKAAPLWFTKMDRNHDGDLSPREFIGAEEDFRKLDADGDKLISAEEARQFKGNPKSEIRNPK